LIDHPLRTLIVSTRIVAFKERHSLSSLILMLALEIWIFVASSSQVMVPMAFLAARRGALLGTATDGVGDHAGFIF
jgi:hypothetical protein